MFVARHGVPFADTRERAIRMQNASEIRRLARENTQAQKSSTHESAIWMQPARAVVARGVRA
jgi:hypothetical protein